MEKQFILAKRKKVNVKLLVAASVIITMIVLHYLDESYGLFGSGENALWFLLLLFPFLIIAFYIDSIKNHKVSGHVYINPSVIKIEKNGVVEIIPMEDITGLEFRFKAICGETPPVTKLFGLWSMYASSDGSGNYLYFFFNGIKYNLNIVLDSMEDFNAIVHLFKMIERDHGCRPVITGCSDDE